MRQKMGTANVRRQKSTSILCEYMLSQNHIHVLAHSLESVSRSLSWYSEDIWWVKKGWSFHHGKQNKKRLPEGMRCNSWVAPLHTSVTTKSITWEGIPTNQPFTCHWHPGDNPQWFSLSSIHPSEFLKSGCSKKKLTHLPPQKKQETWMVASCKTQKSKQWPWKTRLKDPWLIFGTLFSKPTFLKHGCCPSPTFFEGPKVTLPHHPCRNGRHL